MDNHYLIAKKSIYYDLKSLGVLHFFVMLNGACGIRQQAIEVLEHHGISKLNRLPKLGNLREYIDRNHYQLEEVQQQLYDELKQQLQQYLEK